VVQLNVSAPDALDTSVSQCDSCTDILLKSDSTNGRATARNVTSTAAIMRGSEHEHQDDTGAFGL
jgi:hypothetical protein